MTERKNNIQLKPIAEKKVFSYIGLAAKAGKLASGEFSTEKAVKSNKANLVLVATDASNNTKKMFTNMCTYYDVPIYFFGSKEELGKAIGKELRASVCLLDRGLSDVIRVQLDTMNDGKMLDNIVEPNKWR